MSEKLTETVIVDKIVDFMINKVNGNWHEEKVQKNELHKHGVDIKLVGGKRNSEYFFIECKGKSYAKSARSVNRECFRPNYNKNGRQKIFNGARWFWYFRNKSCL